MMDKKTFDNFSEYVNSLLSSNLGILLAYSIDSFCVVPSGITLYLSNCFVVIPFASLEVIIVLDRWKIIKKDNKRAKAGKDNDKLLEKNKETKDEIKKVKIGKIKYLFLSLSY